VNGKGRYILSLKKDTTFICSIHTGEQIDQRRFSGAVRTDDGNQFAWLNIEIDFVNRVETAKALVKSFNA
jgi:hypothetical protein